MKLRRSTQKHALDRISVTASFSCLFCRKRQWQKSATLTGKTVGKCKCRLRFHAYTLNTQRTKHRWNRARKHSTLRIDWKVVHERNVKNQQYKNKAIYSEFRIWWTDDGSNWIKRHATHGMTAWHLQLHYKYIQKYSMFCGWSVRMCGYMYVFDLTLANGNMFDVFSKTNKKTLFISWNVHRSHRMKNNEKRKPINEMVLHFWMQFTIMQKANKSKKNEKEGQLCSLQRTRAQNSCICTFSIHPFWININKWSQIAISTMNYARLKGMGCMNPWMKGKKKTKPFILLHVLINWRIKCVFIPKTECCGENVLLSSAIGYSEHSMIYFL